MGKHKPKVTAKYSYDELVRYAEIGEAVSQQLPALVDMLLRRKRKKPKAKNGTVVLDAALVSNANKAV